MTRITKIALFTNVAILLLCLVDEAFACSCAGRQQPCEAYWAADAVFVGRVKSKEITNSTVRVTFSITEAFRGVSGTEVDVFTSDSSASCGFDFADDHSYIVYAGNRSHESGRLYTSICSRTQRYFDSSPDISFARSVSRAAPGSVIFGTVTFQREETGPNAQRPFPNIRVVITANDKQISTMTNLDGRFSVSNLSAGQYTVTPEFPEGMVTTQGQKVSVADRGCAEVHFQGLWDGRLSGVIHDSDGNAVKGGKVYLVDAETGREALLGYNYSDENGNYEVKRIMPGRYQVLLQYLGLVGRQSDAGDSYQGQPVLITIGEGQKIRNLALQLPPLPPKRPIEGAILHSDGKPFNGAFLAYGNNSATIEKIKTDDQGRFSFKAYEGGKYSINVIVNKDYGELVYNNQIDIPKGTEKSPLKLMITIDPHRVGSTLNLK